MTELQEMTDRKNEFRDMLERSSYIKSDETRLINVLKGHSVIQMSTLPALNENNLTFVFFTRPNLNLSDINLSRNRRMLQFANVQTDSVQRFIRGTLSPREVDVNNLVSKALNHSTPFIPLLSNTLETLSGWPDEMVQSWVSTAGIMGEQWGHVNSPIVFNGSFELDATFYNVIEDPVSKMMDLWTTYSSEVRYGNFMPWIGSIANRETDYFTGIYVIVTNLNYKIKHIAKTNGYPVANPKGIYFDYKRDESKGSQFRTFNTRFKCYGAEYDDPAIMMEFNLLMSAFNSDINSTLSGKGEDIVEIPGEFREMFQGEGYPLIDLENNTLDYVISKTRYKKVPIPVKK